MKTSTSGKPKDQRIAFNNTRVVAHGNVWHFDGKYDPATQKLKIYRVFGDITDPRHREAIRAHALEAINQRMAA